MQRLLLASTARLNFVPVYWKVEFMKQPKMRRRTITPVYPPPGMNLEIPEEWEPELFLLRIGGGASEFADKFENLNEIFNADRMEMKKRGVPPKIRKHIFRIREELRRGVLTFEYLSRRTATG